MAVIAKKINIQKGSITQEVNLYNTLAEVGNENYINLTVDGVEVYAKYGATNDPRATNGRVDIKETTYALLSMAIPPYGIQTYTFSGTFTVPSGCAKLRVTCVGGGGGGATSHRILSRWPQAKGKSGGTSSVGSLLSSTGGAGAGQSFGDLSRDYGYGGGNNGYTDTGYGIGGKGGDVRYETVLGGTGGTNGGNGSSGQTKWVGGGGEDSPYEVYGGGGGGAGRSVRMVMLDILAGQVLHITVGGGGSGGTIDPVGQFGTSGLVIIEWGLGVE